jgi:hypothetical protein
VNLVTEARALAEAHPRRWVVCFGDDLVPFRALGGAVYTAPMRLARHVAATLHDISRGREICAMPCSSWVPKRIERLDRQERATEERRSRTLGQSAQLTLF